VDNNWPIIKLDELIQMERHDFYDKVHTTPQGSKRIANIIYPYLKEILNK
jgi:lysophospholipase L1-like esterase